MQTPNQETVQRVLALNDRGARCRKAIEDGWKAVREKHPDLAWWRRKSTRAAVMWENTIDMAIANLIGQPGVRHIPHYDTASFVFDETVLARFKLADIGLKSSNYPTSLARLFHQHEAHDLFGFEGFHRVEIVHVLNRFNTAIDWIGVVARDRRKILWHFELPVGGAASVAPFTPPLPRPAPAADRVLRPSKPETEKPADEEGK